MKWSIIHLADKSYGTNCAVTRTVTWEESGNEGQPGGTAGRQWKERGRKGLRTRGRAGSGRCPCWALGGDHGKGAEDGKRETGLRLAVAGGRSQKTWDRDKRLLGTTFPILCLLTELTDGAQTTTSQELVPFIALFHVYYLFAILVENVGVTAGPII